jgi:RHS repeat-associated protein
MKYSLGRDNPFRYRGYYYDIETRLFYVGSRYYDPEMGRFLNADATDVLTASMDKPNWDKNLFEYCDNNPIMRADSNGQFWHIVGGAVIGGLIGGISSIVGQAVSGNGINWGEVGISAASGALTGAITAAVPGMGALANGTCTWCNRSRISCRN